MNQQTIHETRSAGISLPAPLCRWWLRARPTTRGIQLNNDMPPCFELYVPWWAWPLELAHRLFFGQARLKGNDD